MQKLIASIAVGAAVAAALATSAFAELKVGTKAPDFTAPAYLADAVPQNHFGGPAVDLIDILHGHLLLASAISVVVLLVAMPAGWARERVEEKNFPVSDVASSSIDALVGQHRHVREALHEPRAVRLREEQPRRVHRQRPPRIAARDARSRDGGRRSGHGEVRGCRSGHSH